MSKSKVILVIQARMGSTRLPGKSNLDLAGVSLVGRILERIRRCKTFQDIVLAIPENKENDVLYKIGEQFGVKVFRGSENNLLDRYYRAAKLYDANYVARLPADNPLSEPEEIDKLIIHHLGLSRRGFSSNLSSFFNSGYPDGIGIEVFDFSLLEEAHQQNTEQEKNEHIHLNFFDYKTQKAVDNEWCPISTIKCPEAFSRPELILDVNTYDQYLFIRDIYEYLYPKNPNFGILDIINWYDNVYKKKVKFSD